MQRLPDLVRHRRAHRAARAEPASASEESGVSVGAVGDQSLEIDVSSPFLDVVAEVVVAAREVL